MNKQVDKKAYKFESYCYPERWHSYWHQLNEIFLLKPKSVLEIGSGDKIVANYIKNNSDIIYKSADVAEDLYPDIVCSADNINSGDESFELVCAFEVLEHLPFERFERSLKELGRVTQKFVIISLPHWGRHFSIEVKLPFLKSIRYQFKISRPSIKHKFNGQHYWEIGKKGFGLKKIKSIIVDSGYNIRKDYIAFHSPYHHFFILEKS